MYGDLPTRSEIKKRPYSFLPTSSLPKHLRPGLISARLASQPWPNARVALGGARIGRLTTASAMTAATTRTQPAVHRQLKGASRVGLRRTRLQTDALLQTAAATARHQRLRRGASRKAATARAAARARCQSRPRRWTERGATQKSATNFPTQPSCLRTFTPILIIS